MSFIHRKGIKIQYVYNDDDDDDDDEIAYFTVRWKLES